MDQNDIILPGDENGENANAVNANETAAPGVGETPIPVVPNGPEAVENGPEDGEEAVNTGAAPEKPPVAEKGPVAHKASSGDPGPVAQSAAPEERPKGRKRRVSPFADSPYVAQEPTSKPRKAPREKKKGGKAVKVILTVLLVLALVAGACAVTAQLVSNSYESRLQQMESRFATSLQELEAQMKAISRENILAGNTQSGNLTPAQVYAMNSDSVVLIHNVKTAGTSTGSGFILTADGYVVTNHHVIDGTGTLTVITSDGLQHSAVLVGSDSANDVALLKMEGKNLQPVILGDSDRLIVGDQVAAIGNPLGELTSTLTVGYISAMERDVNTSGFAINMLQTDAAINSGNSGGPLFNMNGEVIGITTAKYSGNSASGASIEGIGFAIPINDVRDLLEDLAANGRSTSPYLGVSVTDMDAAAAEYFGLPMGARVSEVVPGSCSQKAGLKVKDIIVSLGGYEVGSVNELTRVLRKFKAGDTVEMIVFRSGARMSLTITLDERPDVMPQPGQSIPEATVPSLPEEGMPSEGDLEEWFKYLFPFFNNGN